MSDDSDETLHATKPLEPAQDTPRAEALRIIARAASLNRFAAENDRRSADRLRAVADELERAQDWLAAQVAREPKR